MTTAIENVMTWEEAEKKVGLEELSYMEERKYVFIFTDSGQKQYASADDPQDENEGWSLGRFVE